jgi:hypothetical protein
MSARKHLARRWYSKGGLILRCHCGEYKPVKGTVREQEDAHRAHRVAMGETVQPRKASEVERLRKRVAELEAAAVETTVEYGTAFQSDEASDEEVHTATDNRKESETRVGRYRNMHPDAHLVQRTVHYGPWTEVTS